MILDSVQDFREGYRTAAAAIRPLIAMDTSAWADSYRMLPVSEAEPGPWRTDRMPPLREIMDVLSPTDPTEMVVFKKSAQVGGTEVGMNWLGCTIHLEPGRFIQVQPTLETSRRYSKSRIAPLIEATPVLRKLIAPARKRDSGNTLLAKEYPGGILIMTGANSAVGLRSTPCRYIFGDEIDAWPDDVDNEGDPIRIVIERSRTYQHKRKIYLVSTPTIDGLSNIDKYYDMSDKRRYYVPCPFCGVKQVLVWSKKYATDLPEGSVIGQVVWPPNQPIEAQYECGACQGLWGEGQKAAIVAAGEWIAEQSLKPGMPVGFHLNALYSPWISWAEMALDFLQSKDDPSALKDFINLKLGESWKDIGLGADFQPSGLMKRCELYEAEVPDGVLVITAGIDVQDDRLEVEIVGWGEGEEAFSLGHTVLWGDPSSAEVWQELDKLLLAPLLDTHGKKHYIQGSALDTGGHHTLSAYNFCRPRQRRRVWAIKGQDGQRPVWPRKASKNNKARVPLYSIGVDTVKERIYARLKYPPPGRGRMHFQIGCSEEYFRQLTSEVQTTTRRRGRQYRAWELKPNRRNEVLDTWVYAYAALYGLIAHGLKWEPLHVLPGGASEHDDESAHVAKGAVAPVDDHGQTESSIEANKAKNLALALAILKAARAEKLKEIEAKETAVTLRVSASEPVTVRRKRGIRTSYSPYAGRRR